MNFDYIVFKFINDFAERNIFLDQLGVIFAKYLIIILFLLVIIAFFQFRKNILLKSVILNVFLSIPLGIVINYLISWLYFRPRPFVFYPVHQLIEKSAFDKAFPSDHTTISFALAFSLYFYNKKLGIIAFVLAFLVGLGRIYVGIHYPLDILAGILVGFLSSFLVYNLIKYLRKKYYGKFNKTTY